MKMENHRKHYSIFWPVLLITVGIVLFLNNVGRVSGSTWDLIWNLWPLLFIVGGIDALVNRSGFAGPVVGIGLGTIFLLGNFGYLPVPALEVLIKFWPVLLIAWGIDLIIDHRGVWSPIVGILLGVALIAGTYYLAMYSPAFAQKAESQEITLASNGATVAKGTLSMPMGQMTLAEGAGEKNLLEGTVTASGKVNSNVQVSGTSATFWVKDTTEGTYTPFTGTVSSLDWNLKLNKAVLYDLESTMGAGSSEFDLQGLQLDRLSTSTGVGKLVVTLPDTGSETVDTNMAVGQVIFYVPQDAAVKFQMDNALVLPAYPADFMKSGNVVFSPEAATATEVQVIRVNSAVGLVSIQYLP
jgi:hypothetical protein